MDTVDSRVEKASAQIGIPKEAILKILGKIGIENNEEGLSLLDHPSTTEDFLFSEISKINTLTIFEFVKQEIAPIKLKILVGTMKGEKSPAEVKSQPQVLLEAPYMFYKPIEQKSDSELLDEYLQSEDERIEFELNKRAKGRRFIVTNDVLGNDINKELTLQTLKQARKQEIPALFTQNGSVFYIYRIEEFHPSNRLRDESPLAPGVALFNDFCPVTNFSFEGITHRMRQFFRIAIMTYPSKQELQSLYSLELKNVEPENGKLPQLFPVAFKTFKETELLGTLPSLKLIENLKPTIQHQDPFSVGRK